MSNLKKLPIGIQTFSNITKGKYLYIDKTDIAYKLINDFKYVFLSRPRRFGKSLFLDTLKNIFEGNRELFEGLAIYDKWDWSVKYPVIKISWDGRNRSIEDLKSNTRRFIKDNQERLKVICDEPLDDPTCFYELIQKTYKKYNQPVVVLIDEYDKPILDVIENKVQAKEHREYIKGLYSIIKGCDEYIRFAFLTGVSKFSKASIFSGLNMLTDISLNPKYGNICGYTQDDIETSFLPYLKGADMERFRDYYNGYNFLKDPVYNPFDTLQFIANDFKYSNYWFNTGTPTYLIKLIKENNYYLPNLLDLIVGEELLDSFDVENIKFEVILYQAGYLTIDKVIEEDMGFAKIIKYKLKIPNIEVKVSLNNFILQYLYDINTQNYKFNTYKSLKSANLEELKDTLISLFASIPYSNYTNNNIQNYEGYYSSILYVYFASLGIKMIGEDVTSRGRIDLTLFIEDKIYIIEFKVIENGKLKMENEENSALVQIKEKRYYEKYLNSQFSILNSQLFLVGIEFGKEERNIVGFEWEEIEK